MLNFKDLETIFFNFELWADLESLKEFYKDRNSSVYSMAAYKAARKKWLVQFQQKK